MALLTGPGPGGLAARVRTAVRTLHPGSFALVMATGIVSVGMRDHVPWISATLLVLTAAFYLVLLVLTCWRAGRFPGEVRADLAHPVRGFGAFTFVAGSHVLGTRLALDGHTGAAAALLVIGGAAWLVLGYLVPWSAAVNRDDRPTLSGANGTWFIWVVASQSVAVLAALLVTTVDTGRRELALLAVGTWAVGVVTYGVVGGLVAVRLVLHPVRPADFHPPYWVAMGATAITVLAGARILSVDDVTADAVRPVVTGLSVVFWAFGTWLIPALLAAGWWRHALRKVPLRYEATWWSVVFPVGMYGVAARTLGEGAGLPLIATIGRYEIWVALAVWTFAFVAMLVHLARVLLRRTPAA